MRRAIVWKKDIYDNGLECTCGRELWDADAKRPLKGIGVAADRETLLCPSCHRALGKVVTISENLAPGFYGDYEKWLENHTNG